MKVTLERDAQEHEVGLGCDPPPNEALEDILEWPCPGCGAIWRYRIISNEQWRPRPR